MDEPETQQAAGCRPARAALALGCRAVAVVNVAAVVLRRDGAQPEAFRAPRWTPWVTARACLYLAGPWARLAEDRSQYQIAGAMLLAGVGLWVLTWASRRRGGEGGPRVDDPGSLAD